MKAKKIVIGVTGGIAAYKMASVVSALHKEGADVQVIMTRAATEFITPLTMQVLSKKHVYTDTFDSTDVENVAHINIAQSADLVVVAPATANIIAKMATGIADDMLSTTLLAVKAPIILVPSMNEDMYNHPTVVHNLQVLAERGVQIMEPAHGYLAEGYSGKGRLPEPEEILAEIRAYFSLAKDFEGKSILITAGGTREAIDPVRFISNHSTGKMGYALAAEALKRGGRVTLVAGATDLVPPRGVDLVKAETAAAMYQAVMDHLEDADIIIKTAAVADYRPQQISAEKIKKGDDDLILTLERTKDIAAEVGAKKAPGQLLVGFSAETSNLIENAKRKLTGKNMDLIIANNILQAGAGFGVDTNIITIIKRSGEEIALPLMSKRELAGIILDEIKESLLGDKN